VILCIVSFPIQGFAQNPNSVTLQEVKPLPKPEIKFKGWYLGADFGVVNSSFRYRIPEDPITGLYAQNSTFFGFGDGHVEAEIGSSFFAELKAKCVAGKYLTLDFINLVKYDQVPITLYEYVSTGWFSGSMVPREKYELNIATNQILIMPHLKTSNPNYYFFVGLGLGINSVLYRGGNFSRKYHLFRFSPMYRTDIGFAVRVKENYINFTISGSSITRLADYYWSAKMNYTTFTLGYSLPISDFKKKPKTATL
jgi:hypothetical protein